MVTIDAEEETSKADMDERAPEAIMSESEPVGKLTITEKAPAPIAAGPLRKFFMRSRVIRRVYCYLHRYQAERAKLKLRYEKTSMGMDLLRKNDVAQALKLFQETIASEPSMFEAHFGIAQAQCSLQQFDRAVTHVRLVAERSSAAFADEIRAFPQVQLAQPYDPLFDGSSSTLTGTPNFSLVINCLAMWGLALTSLKDFTNAVKLCEIVLRHSPNNKTVKRVKATAEEGMFHEVVGAVSKHERWYACPRGHLYMVGGCGSPMQIALCPDCGVTIGVGSGDKVVGRNGFIFKRK